MCDYELDGNFILLFFFYSLKLYFDPSSFIPFQSWQLLCSKAAMRNYLKWLLVTIALLLLHVLTTDHV